VVSVDDVPSPAVKDPGLRDRKYDLSLARLPIPLPADQIVDDLNVENLFDDPLVLAAGTHNRLTRRRKIDLAELIDEPWILPRPNTWNYAFVAEAFKARGLDMPKARMIGFSVHLTNHFLINGPFITAYPRSVLRLHGLKSLPVDVPVRPFPVAILTLKNRTLSPVVECFIECARAVARPLARLRSHSG
jgi:DNA-binding transcriptional LysR family regulator